jgi:hypothetical protein
VSISRKGVSAFRQSLAKVLAVAMLCAQTLPAPMMPPAQALFGLYGITDICTSNLNSPAGAPTAKCDTCCWGHCSHSASGLLPETASIYLPGAWTLRDATPPVVRQSDRRIFNAAQPRGPPLA